MRVRRNRRLAAGAMVALAWLVAAAPAKACWVDRVERAPNGVRVYFQSGRTVSVMRPGKPAMVLLVDQTKPEEPATNKLPARVKRVEGALGDQFMSFNSPHDGCRLTVATLGNTIGLWAQAWTGMPGERPSGTEYFIASK